MATERPGSRAFAALFVCVWATAFILDSVASEDWVTGAVLAAAVAAGAALLRAGRQTPGIQAISPRRAIVLPAVCWLGIMAAVTAGVRNDTATYLPLVLMYFPLWGAWKTVSLKGFRHAPAAWLLGLGALATLPVCIVYLWPLGGRYFDSRVLSLAPLAVGFSLLSAALPEELFFRKFLQSRLVRVFGAGSGILLTAVLFALYHYPFALWMPDWPTSGQPLRALVYVLDQKMAHGVLFGAIYYRTSSLRSAVAGHALVNACWLLSTSMH